MKSEQRIKKEIEMLKEQRLKLIKYDSRSFFEDLITNRIETLKWMLEDD